MNVSRTGYFTSDYLDRRRNQSSSTLPSRSMSPDSTPSTPRRENPDELDEAITPAHLNYLYKKQRTVDYSDYYKPKRKMDDSSSFHTQDLDSVQDQPRSIPAGYEGYYIDQKKRYEDAEEVKPRMFTHKTFMDVFDRDQDERFNPIDKTREQEKKQKLSRAMKSVQKKVGINDYNSYDYYTQNELDEKRAQKEREKAKQKSEKKFKLAWKKKKQEKDQELFVQHVSDNSDDEEMEGYENDPQNENIKKAWKRKWKNAKKALGDDYFDNYNREKEARLNQKAKSIEEPESEAEVRQGSIGPNDNFHPLWNYMLSWLVYNSATTQASTTPTAPVGKIVEIDKGESITPSKKKRNKLKDYKTKMKRWNEPASAYFGNKAVPDTRAIQKFDQASTIYTESEFPEEIELSDDGNLSDEIALSSEVDSYQYPPTSAQAMMTRESRFGKLHEGGPVKIVSNINSLIKSIKIMKIIFAPIDIIATVVILIELVIFMWILYELSLLIDALCMAVKAICAPMIAIGKFMNRIV
ncbi:uncharacterized protein CXQ87_005259 [Candidozyma duobushaemuli]|uniref:Uncharacterized protein n=1 Tax=Candidozyma duobushaemuli TaxID=1231522 RepID=A0A2V1AA81_9ASCO|nr:uncharacterized protein CXQ87_005259 [[Candida] duobushaemulonis]PVH14980.1 hypothetical protein CXQ87_005259 [[Candida] duobushaemulonis]